MKTLRHILTTAIAGAATLALLLNFLGSPAAGKGKPGGGGGGEINVAFAYVEAESDGIFVTTIDGANTRQLTSPQRRTKDRSPTWSPDLDPQTPGYQGKIAYLHSPDVYTKQLYLINADGSDRQLVRSFGPFPDPVPGDTSAGKTHLAWSPNGKEIAFSALAGDALFAVEIATGNVRLLLDRLFPDRQIAEPAISPLGMLAFVTDGDIYVVDFQLDAAGLMQVDLATASIVNVNGNSFATVDLHPSWSPDGTRLAFIRFVTEPNGEEFDQLVVYDGLLDEFTLVLQEPEPRLSTVTPTWSPDGSEIAIHAWTTTANGKDDWDIVRILNWHDPETRLVVPVTETDRAVEGWPAWNPGWQSP